jgi:hypothetical protein
MPDTNTIEFPKPALEPPPASGTGGYRLSGTQGGAPARIARHAVRGSTALAPIEIDKLYPADKNYVSDLIAALSVLADAIGLLEKARAAARNKDAFTADRYWQRFQSLLPGLFTRRKIGDGYGAVINALHFACVNQHGAPVSLEQLTTVWRVIKELRNAPVITFEQALKYVQELEDCHLQVYPTTISELIQETEDDESIRGDDRSDERSLEARL